MAEAIVSTILEQLATIGVEEARREVNLVLGAEEEVRKLSSNFLAIQAVLGDAEVQQLKNPSVRDWVEKLRAVSYDIEDVLDEWNTALMRTRLERGGDAPHPTNKFLGLEELEEWEDNAEESTISIMPSLRSIFLGFCPKLKALPDYLLQPNKLQKLTISQCPILKERFQKETGEDWPKICCIPEIEITS